MARAKQKKQFDRSERAVIAKQNEKIINDFLLQFAYTLTMCVITIFAYNAIAAVNYGSDTARTMRFISWALFVVCLAVGIILTVVYKLKKKDVTKTAAIYSYVTALIMFWYVGVEKIPFYLKETIPFIHLRPAIMEKAMTRS